MLKNLLIGVFIIGNLGIAYAQYAETDWEDRDNWMDVQQIFNYAGIEEGSMVADIGCHEGYISFHLSETVGNKGKVFAVDVREDRLETLNEIARKKGKKNIETILGDYDNPHLPKNSLDVVLIIDAYHEIREYKEVLSHIKKALKPNGRILILEKLKSEIIGKSRSEQTTAHSLSSDYVEDELLEAGFVDTQFYDKLGYWENNEEKKIWIMVGILPSS